MSSYYTSSSSSDDSSDVDDKMENLNIVDKNEINILLIGGTGVGKSTFINAMGNYISIKFFHDAEKIGMVKLIPTVFKIRDKYKKEHEIKIGPKKDANECLKIGESATQNVKTYVFPAWEGKGKIRLIDTPGMGDTRGIEKDEQNCENIINYVKKLGKLHAICFLCKPTETRRTVYFDYCIYMILSHFEKDIAKNLFFIFTNTRGSNYGPGDTLSILKIIIKSIEDISSIKIDLKNRVFCFDNEGFRFLAALEKKIEFDQTARDKFIKSWEHSAKQCWRLIKHLRYDVEVYIPAKLTEVNLAKKLLLQFSKSLVEISQSIQDNQNILVRVRDNKTRELNSITELKSQKTTVTDVIQTKMSQPMLVCTSVPSCAQVYRVRGEEKWHYKRMCHACYEVGNDIRTFTVGCPDIINCHMINGVTRKCNQCGCDFLLHMYIDYVTSLKEDLLLDDDVSHRIATRESLLNNCDEIVDDINELNVLFQSEYDIIKLCCMNLSRYIKGHSILAFSDSYKEYIVYLINQQQSTSSSSIKTSIESLNKLKQQYIEAELAFKEALKSPIVSRKDINFDMSDVHFQNLFTLKNKGKELSDIYHYQKKSVSQDCQIQEYVHDHYFKNKSRNRKNPEKDNRNRRDRRNRSTQNLAANYPERPDSRSSTSSYHSTRSDNRNVHEHNKGYHPHPPNFNQNNSQYFGGQANPRYPPPNYNYPDPRNHPRGHQDSYNVNLTVNRNPSHGPNYPPSQQHYPPPHQQYPQSQQYPPPHQQNPPPHPQYPSQQQYGYPPQGAYGYTPPPPNQYPEQHRGQNHASHSRGRSANRGRYNKNDTNRRSEGNTRGRNATRGGTKDFARAKSGDRYNKDGMRGSRNDTSKKEGTDVNRRGFGSDLQESRGKKDSETDNELKNNQKCRGRSRTKDRSDSRTRNGSENKKYESRPFGKRGMNRTSHSRDRLNENQRNTNKESNSKDNLEAESDNELKNYQKREGRSRIRDKSDSGTKNESVDIKYKPRTSGRRGINRISHSRDGTRSGLNENQRDNEQESVKKNYSIGSNEKQRENEEESNNNNLSGTETDSELEDTIRFGVAVNDDRKENHNKNDVLKQNSNDLEEACKKQISQFQKFSKMKRLFLATFGKKK